jgi:hypothetical protein
MLMLGVAAVCAGAGSALFASPALAGAVDTGSGYLTGALYNLTPYTWTKVEEASPAPCQDNDGHYTVSNCWYQQDLPGTIAPAGSAGYTLDSNHYETPDLPNGFRYTIGYDAWVTYQVDVLGGPPEYVTFAVSNCYCGNSIVGISLPHLDVWNTTAPPPASYDPGLTDPASPPGTPTANPQVTYAHNVPYMFDQSFSLTGDHTFDASTAQGQALGNLLNQFCSDGAGTTCSFTQVGPTVYGPGTLTNTGFGFTCTGAGGGTGGQPSSPSSSTKTPLKADPGWVEVQYTASETASLTVGGSVTVGTQFNLFDTIAGKISVSVQAQHEWSENKTLTRAAYVYIPDNSIGKIFVAPTVGTVTGTLMLTTGSSTYTVTNFSETRDGVGNDGNTTQTADPANPTNPNGLPQFEVLSNTYPMTPSEHSQLCPNGQPAGLGSVMSRPAPTRLVPGRGVAKVQLGESQSQVSRTLGRPRTRLFSPWPCYGLQRGCRAVPAAGGIWLYRGLSIRFAADRHVAGLVYRGDRRTARGLGVRSTLNLVRATFPRASCTPIVDGKHFAKRVFCTLAGRIGSAPAETVFRFKRPRGHPFVCDQVAIDLVDPKAQGTA